MITVADLIAELQKLPGHLPVYAALDADDYDACDTRGLPVSLNLTPELDCLSVDRVAYEGTHVEIIGCEG